MKKQHCGYSLFAFAMLAISASASATDLNVNFTANIRETTCDMKLMGGTGSDTDQTLTLGTNGQVRMDDIKTGNITAPFKIILVECPSSLKSLKTTVKGTPVGILPTALTNQLISSGGANWTGVQISRVSAPDAPFTINSTEDAKRLVWTSTELANKEVSLVAKMLETNTGEMTPGAFKTVATFEFTYE
ncbi:fimbrial protein [Enterobacter sp. RIT637]|uniref:fimbrial protein n=1 Tax=Enterobacter sp. RIT637 TaxID=2870470 RepID=UPI001C879D93|nr:fimbrial protein [Enterobacter sp. RIT637]MBX8461526.1 fimbrial protein [Enterobacter sp. RIT637]